MGKLRKEEVNGEEYLVAGLAEGERVDEDSLAAVSGEQTPDGKEGIEGILPISYSQLMGERVLRYNINACIPFAEYKKQIRQKEALCKVFLSILDTYALADSYLLDPSCFLLEQDYIYVSRSTGKACLVLYPAVGQERTGSQDFRALFREMLRGIRLADEDMAFYGTLSYELDSMEVFNRAAFRELLLKEGSRAGSGGRCGEPGGGRGAGAAGASYAGAGIGAGAPYGGAGTGAGAAGTSYGGAGTGTGAAGASYTGAGTGAGAAGGRYRGAGAGAGAAGGRYGEPGGGRGAGEAYGEPGGAAGGRYGKPGELPGAGGFGRASAGLPGKDGAPPKTASPDGEERGFLGGLFGRRKEKAGQEKEPGRRGLAGKAEDKKAGKAEDNKFGKAEDKKAAKAEERKAKKEQKGKGRASGIRLPDAEELPEGFLAVREEAAQSPRERRPAEPAVQAKHEEVGAWAPAPWTPGRGGDMPEIPQTVDDEVEIPPTDDEIPADTALSLYLKQTDTGQVTKVSWFPFEIGREVSGLLLDPDKTKVSRQHAVISRTEEGFTIRDVSRLGTFLDGVRIPKGEEVPLENGMKVLFKEVEFLVIIDKG